MQDSLTSTWDGPTCEHGLDVILVLFSEREADRWLGCDLAHESRFLSTQLFTIALGPKASPALEALHEVKTYPLNKEEPWREGALAVQPLNGGERTHAKDN